MITKNNGWVALPRLLKRGGSPSCKICLTAIAALMLTGCNLDENNTHKKPSHAAHASDSPTVKLVPVTPQSVPEAGQYCFVTKVYDKEGDTYIDADYVQFLMGDAAIAAAKKKGEAEAVQDDYYIVNDNPKIRSLKLRPDFQYIGIKYDSMPAGQQSAMDYLHSAAKNNLLLILTLNNNQEVLRIKQQYLP